MESFWEHRAFMQDEYRNAEWDQSSGLPPAQLEKDVREFFRQNAELPSVLQRAESFAYILSHAQIQINPHTCFAGKLNLGIDYSHAFAGPSFYERMYCERYRDIFSVRLPEIWAKRAQSARLGITIPDTDFWHICPDWTRVMELGIAGLRKRAESALAERLRSGSADEEHKLFFEAVLLCYDAILSLMDRLSQAALKVGHTEYAQCMTHLRVAPPQTLYQAMTLSLFFLDMVEIGRERGRTLGNLDMLYYPFYRRDIAEGRLDEEKTRELFRYFFCKINAGRRYANQPVCIGGSYDDGSTCVSELTWLMLDVYDELDIENPKIHVKCNGATPDWLYRRIAELMRKGHNSIVLVNDPVLIKAYRKIGVPKEIANRYVPLGCYEPVIPGYEDARICAGWINLAKGVEYAIHGGYDGITGELWGVETDRNPPTFEAFYDAVKVHLKAFVDFAKKCVLEQERYAYEVNPHPLYSSTLDACINNGMDVFNDGMDVRNTSFKVFAIGSAVDSLMAVKEYVYEKKRLTLPQLSAILKADWAGAETLRAEILHNENKWGNGIAEVDAYARDLYAYMGRLIVNTPNGYGGVCRMGADSVNFAEDYGRGTGASADGRLSGKPLSVNLRPVNGMERRAVTGLLNSALSIDQTDFVDGAPLDFMLHPSAVQGEKGLDMIVALIKTYFENGGVSIQGNVSNTATLEKAMAHPEEFQDLQIRVCGWNEYFVNMTKSKQQDFIDRAKGIEG